MTWFRCMGGSGGGTSGTASGDIATFSIPNAIKSVIADITAMQSGSGTPSPSNVRPISGWSATDVNIRGKNLLPPLSAVTTSKGVTFTPRTDGGIDLSGTATGGIAVVDLGRGENIWLNAGTYFVNESTSLYTITVFDETSGTATVLRSGGGRFTITSRTKVFVRLGIPNGTATETAVYIQLELGSSATSFEKYTGTSLNIPFGQTVYGGRLNATTGELTNSGYKITGTDIGTLFLDSQTETVAVFRFRLDTNNFPEAVANTAISNRFDRSIASGNAGRMVQQANLFYIVVNKSDLASLDEEGIKAWLTSNPTEFVYELATPTTVQLTATEIKALSGVNNVWADSGDIEVEYSTISEGGSGYTEVVPLFQDGRSSGNWYLEKANDAKRVFTTFTATGSGKLFVAPTSYCYTNTSSNDGYISVEVNGVEVTRQQLTTGANTTLADLADVSVAAGDVVTINGGYDGSHTGCYFYLWCGFAVAYE